MNRHAGGAFLSLKKIIHICHKLSTVLTLYDGLVQKTLNVFLEVISNLEWTFLFPCGADDEANSFKTSANRMNIQSVYF